MDSSPTDHIQRLPLISDATLRDSAHMAGVEFTPEDATTISRLLRDIGVNLIEVGIVSGPDSRDTPLIAAVHEAVGPERSSSLVMVRDRKQVVAALEEARRLGCRSILLSVPTSVEHARLKLASPSSNYLKSLARTAIGEAKERGFHVTFSGEDGARTELDRLISYVESGFAAGADRFRLAETVATLRPWDCGDIVRHLSAIAGAEIEMHSHNMLGMAVANSLAAFEAGAAWISTTVGGIGERGGNCPLAELLCSLRAAYGDQRYDLSMLTHLTEEAVRRGGFGSSFMPGPTTRHAYAYELLGQLRHPDAYETTPAETVGNRRSLRVRSRLSPALVEFALAGTDLDVDSTRFCDWLVEYQREHGNPVLDQQRIRQLARSAYLPVQFVSEGK
ncbi:hypothetical protein NDR87_17350 [Nocardia sp. CDC159]|uniref:Pyruvate carboxyltransferase domain-containing protein n=1 Tax=Nocardia pulmonis TaxID=2951408 RepID=A0A9X2IXD0_9NOCA|nr:MULTISPECIES: hypothetical protein [Nocardia]MCM6775897.1 hypothetical protein [Nocardia pulmonis]MCM6788127.1 hypothetical protein [Nocardia sp. CDC159]